MSRFEVTRACALVTSMCSNLDCVSLHRGYIALTGFAVVALGLERVAFERIE
jgi:hypothetical protein